MRTFMVTLLVALTLYGCAAPTEEILNLRTENSRLESALKKAQGDIQGLENDKSKLTDRVSQLSRISGTLKREKAVRVEETSLLRQNVHGFVRSQLAALRDFSKNENLLDYSGSELIERSSSLGKSLALIDTQYKISAGGILYGIRGIFNLPAKIVFAVLRPIKGQWVVVWVTKKLDIKEQGLQQIDFPVPVTVQSEDLVGYFFPDKIPVACDQGTGGVIILKKPFEVGQKIDQGPLDKDQGWACSIGVIGVLGE